LSALGQTLATDTAVRRYPGQRRSHRRLPCAPAHVRCLIEVRLIGVISAEQIKDGKKKTNDRLLGVTIHSYDTFPFNAHEVLAIAEGKATLKVGGETGRLVRLKAGDMLVLPVAQATEG
jgi:mannose-6-phosphate isomerase-like protein (cupin superfamily)